MSKLSKCSYPLLSPSSSDLSAVKGSMPFFRKSLEKMHSTRKCPLCTRGFDDSASFERTVKSVSGCIVMSPHCNAAALFFTNSLFVLPLLFLSLSHLLFQITDRLNNTVPRLLPTLEDKQRELQEKQKRLQELKPKIEEVIPTQLGKD